VPLHPPLRVTIRICHQAGAKHSVTVLQPQEGLSYRHGNALTPCNTMWCHHESHDVHILLWLSGLAAGHVVFVRFASPPASTLASLPLLPRLREGITFSSAAPQSDVSEYTSIISTTCSR
jgi:hypothetical protein